MGRVSNAGVRQVDGFEGGVITGFRVETLPSGITQVVVSVEKNGGYYCFVTTSRGVAITGFNCDGEEVRVVC